MVSRVSGVTNSVTEGVTPLRWDWQAVEGSLRRAGETLKRLPVRLPGKTGTGWPGVLREFSDLVAQAESHRPGGTKVRPALPSAQAISEMEDALCWLFLLTDPRERFVVFARGVAGAPWKDIMAHADRRSRGGAWAGSGLGRTQANKVYKDGLTRIARVLNDPTRRPR